MLANSAASVSSGSLRYVRNSFPAPVGEYPAVSSVTRFKHIRIGVFVCVHPTNGRDGEPNEQKRRDRPTQNRFEATLSWLSSLHRSPGNALNGAILNSFQTELTRSIASRRSVLGYVR